MIWNEKYIATDAEIGMIPQSRDQAAGDLQTMLNLATYADLLRLYRAARDGKLIRYTYLGPKGGRCVMGWLFGIESKEHLLRFPFESDAEGFAARRLVRSFDYRWLTDESIVGVLRAEIRKRQTERRQAKEAARGGVAVLA